MESHKQVESGLQLLARLCHRPSLQGLNSILFSNGPHSSEIIEISGNVSSGKTLLLTTLLSKSVLPLKYQEIDVKGFEVHVILINTDHHFQVSKIANILLGHLKKACKLSNAVLGNEELESIVNSSLNRLIIINCYNRDQFFLSIQSLESILISNEKISLIAIDSLSAFYWEDRESGGIWMMDLYIKHLLLLIQKNVSHFNIVTIYTRPSSFLTKGRDTDDRAVAPPMQKLHYKIQLHRQENCNTFFAIVEFAKTKKKVAYVIEADDIKWMEEKEPA
ncbi:DNA repair protein XRCC2 [Orussus abietinus]|uniref:DNA repair protein XRCC2 n=1 Tax=Orussus abietinus TaxID=222816 RepID=UPI000625B4B3|nr:DNA repair protein XRCC2 [Orussus abietinus]XP_012287135.1 DNA repair protein XRCC2 [Orussus abietinus]